MLQGFRNLPNGISVRPARSGDKAFLRKLYRSSRTDLEALNLEPDLFQSILDMQERAREIGQGTNHPNGFEFVLEKLGDPVGRLAVAPEPDGMRIVDLTFIPALRNQGLGTAVIAALQQAAAVMRGKLVCMALCTNPQLRTTLALLGFQVVSVNDVAELLVWTPGTPASPAASV
ncbi:MAG: GNAT family N-acetyltransferase [Rhodospirillaceae bacterium]